jgi:hypothetical protein
MSAQIPAAQERRAVSLFKRDIVVRALIDTSRSSTHACRSATR